jgi:hypothetical protein
LTSITAPTTGSNASARLFLRTVFSDIAQEEAQISEAVLSAVQKYNNSLL